MIVLYIFALIFIITPFFPATRNPHWFFRTADFVRLQSIFIELLLIVLLIIFGDFDETLDISVFIALIVVLVYQIIKVLPYSSVYPLKLPKFESAGCVSIVAANVLQTNTNYQKFKSIIKSYDPDLVLVMEADTKWQKGLLELEVTYPFTAKVPLDNFYGMLLYSKKELLHLQINYLVEEDVPSIFFEYEINRAKNVYFNCLHPAPPSPTENDTSKERDAELMIVGKKIIKKDMPTVVCGDMNDVVWSRITRLFKRMTGMIDPRVGRGFFPTYHAGYRFMRFPLDHLFHTKDLFVTKMERTEYFGSDHFGMYYEINIQKNAIKPVNEKLDESEQEEIEELIEEGKE